jgi:hypothetical protein
MRRLLYAIKSSISFMTEFIKYAAMGIVFFALTIFDGSTKEIE